MLWAGSALSPLGDGPRLVQALQPSRVEAEFLGQHRVGMLPKIRWRLDRNLAARHARGEAQQPDLPGRRMIEAVNETAFVQMWVVEEVYRVDFGSVSSFVAWLFCVWQWRNKFFHANNLRLERGCA